METEAKINAFIWFGPMFIGMFLAFTLPVFGFNGVIAGVSWAVGLYYLLGAKFGLKKRTKVPIEWGTRGMTKKEKTRYLTGYLVLILGTSAALYVGR